MRHVLQTRGDWCRCQCLLDTVSGGASDREEKEHADDVDIGAFSGARLVLVRVLQFGVAAGQLRLG